jgi:hypothetical protein
MKMHKVTMYITDLEEYGEEDMRRAIEQDNAGIVHIADFDTVDIGEFEYEHPLNMIDATTEEHEAYFR